MRRVRTRDRKILESEGAGFFPENANPPHRCELRTPLRFSAQPFVPAVFGALTAEHIVQMDALRRLHSGEILKLKVTQTKRMFQMKETHTRSVDTQVS